MIFIDNHNGSGPVHFLNGAKAEEEISHEVLRGLRRSGTKAPTTILYNIPISTHERQKLLWQYAILYIVPCIQQKLLITATGASTQKTIYIHSIVFPNMKMVCLIFFCSIKMTNERVKSKEQRSI